MEQTKRFTFIPAKQIDRNLFNELQYRNLSVSDEVLSNILEQANATELDDIVNQCCISFSAACHRWPLSSKHVIELPEDVNYSQLPKLFKVLADCLYAVTGHEYRIELIDTKLACTRVLAWDSKGHQPMYDMVLAQANASHSRFLPYRHMPAKNCRSYYNVTEAVRALRSGKAIRVIDVIVWLRGEGLHYVYEDDYQSTDNNGDIICSISAYSRSMDRQSILESFIADMYEWRCFYTAYADTDWQTIPGEQNK